MNRGRLETVVYLCSVAFKNCHTFGILFIIFQSLLISKAFGFCFRAFIKNSKPKDFSLNLKAVYKYYLVCINVIFKLPNSSSNHNLLLNFLNILRRLQLAILIHKYLQKNYSYYILAHFQYLVFEIKLYFYCLYLLKI